MRKFEGFFYSLAAPENKRVANSGIPTTRHTLIFNYKYIFWRHIHMQTVDSSTKKLWALKDVLLLAFVAVFIGVIFWVLGPIYNALSVALTPAGLAPFTNDLLIGGWMMAAPLASVLIKRAGAGVLGEIFAAAVEMLLGGQWGVATLLSGLIQGVASELGFALTGYKNWRWVGIFASAVTGTIVTFAWDLLRSGYAEYNFGLLVALFITRFLSILFFGGVLVVAIQKLIDRSGVLQRD